MQPDPSQPNFSGALPPVEPEIYQTQSPPSAAQSAPPVTANSSTPQPELVQSAPMMTAPQFIAPVGSAVGPPVESFGFVPATSATPRMAPIDPVQQPYQQPMAILPPPQQPLMPHSPFDPQLQQPFQPLQPPFGQPLMPAAPLAAMSGSASNFGTSKKVKIPKIIGIVVAAIALISVIAVAAIGVLANKQISYVKSDLISVSTKAYTVNRAKQWTDLSRDQNVLDHLKASIGSDTPLSDQKVYGYKYDPKTDQGQTLLLVADTPLGVTDDDLRRGLTDSAAKQQFELSFKPLTSSLDSNSFCASTSDKTETINYETSKFLVEVKANVDCNYSVSSQTKYGTKGIHQLILVGIKNGSKFLATIVASQDDWTANGKFYTENIINSVQPK
jgi:hypothetical protein